MKLTYLGTAAAEGWPAAFCNCDGCRAARRLGGRNIRTRSQALVDDALLLDFPCDAWLHALRQGLDFSAVRGCSSPILTPTTFTPPSLSTAADAIPTA